MSLTRGASTLRPWELPGVVAYYQPVVAPDPIAARQNMGAGQLGKYTATPGVVPSWSAPNGWGFNGSTQYFTTGLYPDVNFTAIVVFTKFNPAGSDYRSLFGYYTSSTDQFLIYAKDNNNRTAFRAGSYQGTYNLVLSEGVLAVAGANGYVNGLLVDAGSVGGYNNDTIYLGATKVGAGVYDFFAGNIQVYSFYSRPLSATEVFTASRQMAYCDTVPEFNVWTRQRFYMYLPSAAFLPAWAQNTNRLIGGGVN